LENTLIDIDSIVVDVENTLIDVEKQIDTNSFLQVPELEEPMNIPPILQTSENEDRNAKRTREEGSRLAMEAISE